MRGMADFCEKFWLPEFFAFLISASAGQSTPNIRDIPTAVEAAMLRDHTLTCIEPTGRILDVLKMVRDHNHGKLAGFPDLIGVFSDGRVALREAKCVDAKDRLNAPQHKLADLLRSLLGDKLDLKVIEWGANIEVGET
jgi:hypothetical protein